MLRWFKGLTKHPRIYLDTAAGTPVRREVLSAMLPYFREHYGNPGALYKEGVEAARVLKEARAKAASALSVRPEEITFTSGGTEANNLAILGFVRAECKRGAAPADIHVISTALEHSSVLEPLKELEALGVSVDLVPVTEEGIIDLEKLKTLLRKETRLLSIHLVNNEIGVIQPLRDVARLLKDVYGDERPLLHTDASQALLFLNCMPERLQVDLLTLDAQKIYGPKGVGLLFHHRHITLVPTIHGGGQERGLRSGTEPIPLIVGMAEALTLASQKQENTAKRVRALRDRFIYKLKEELPFIELNGSAKERIANNVNISIPGVDTEFLVLHLDKAGIAVSTKSTCLTDEPGSYAVAALGKGREYSESTLRITLSPHTTWKELSRTVRELARVVQKLRRS